MSSQNLDEPSTSEDDGDAVSSHAPPDDVDVTEQSPEVLLAQLEQLQAENHRLREEYAAAQRTQYQRTAIGFYLIGVVSILGALLLSEVSEILFAIGATGLFAGLLTYYLTPEQFVAASISERISSAYSETLAALITDLGLQETQVYVPVGESPGQQLSAVLLFIPQAARYEIPTEPTPGVNVSDETSARGVIVVPTGGVLLQEFERAIDGSLLTSPAQLADQLAEGVTEQFELADSVSTELAPIPTKKDLSSPEQAPTATETAVESPAKTRLTVVVEEPIFTPGKIDQPIISFVAAGIARAIDAPVEVIDIERNELSDGYDFSVKWDTNKEQSPN